MRELTISNREAAQRLDKYLLKYMDQASKGFIFKMLRKKNIKVNGKKADAAMKLQDGDCIQLFLADETIDKFRSHRKSMNIKKVEKTFDVVYEDEGILVCNKPIGLLSQRDKTGTDSLVEEVTSYLLETGAYDPDRDFGYKPGVCNRLDRNTSGIVLVGKTLEATKELNRIIRERQIDKIYTSIVAGKLERKGQLTAYLTKDTERNTVRITKNPVSNDSEKIETYIEPVEYLGNQTVLHIKLITGKSHQIRAQLAAIKHPVVGDLKYGDIRQNRELNKDTGLRHQLLHAGSIKFHDIEGPLSYLSNKVITTEETSLYKRVYNFFKSNNQ